MNAAQLRKYPTSRRTSQDGENPLSHRIERLRDFRFPEVQIVCAVAEIGIPRKCEGCYRLLGQLPSGLIRSAILGHELTCSISGKRPPQPRTVSLPRGPSGSSPAGSSPPLPPSLHDLPVGILADHLAVAERVEIAAADLDPRSARRGSGEGPFRYAG